MDSHQEISSRKQQHVELCLTADVEFRSKTTGFEKFELEYCALPEIDLVDVICQTSFLGYTLQQPLLLSGMTGGYAQAEHINRDLAEVCQQARIAMGVGSQRQAMVSDSFHASFATVRKHAPNIPILANIGAAEVALEPSMAALHGLVDLIQADAIVVHLNPLQELLQPEGTPRFRSVLQGIERIVRELNVPVAVKEVGAGISARVASSLLDVGVHIIDVAGAGGTSWAGVELLRSRNPELAELWDYGIPTVDCLREVGSLRQQRDFQMISSGGLKSGFEVAKSLALGADIAAAARPFLKKLVENGQAALQEELESWQRQLRATMFLCGARTIDQLKNVPLRWL